MIRLICIKNPAIIISAPDELVSEVGGNCWQIGGPQPLTYPKHLWKKESRPSLPSNLDEAAEFDKMFEDFCDQHPDGLTLNECAEFFYDKGKQAGAEWMAGQGVTVDGEICIPNAFREPKEGAELVARAELSKESGFKFGDKVVVQIRKK